MGNIRVGVHGSTAGWTPRVVQVCDASGATGPYLYMQGAGHGPQDALLEASRSHEDAVHFVRLYTPFLSESDAMYVDRIAPYVDHWLQEAGGLGGRLIFIPGNEPDQQTTDGDVPAPWLDAGAWADHALRVIGRMRRRWPGIVLANAAMMVEHTHWLSPRVLASVDWATCHAYWNGKADNPDWETYALHREDFGQSFIIARTVQSDTGQPLVVTEVNSVNGTEPGQIARWLKSAEGHIYGCCLFMADGQREWAAYDVSPDQAAQIVAAYHAEEPPAAPAPTPDPAPAPPKATPAAPFRWVSGQLWFDLVGAGEMAGVHGPLFSHEAYDQIIPALEIGDVDPVAFLTITTSEGNNGTNRNLAALEDNNLGGVEYVGQTTAYMSQARFPDSEQNGQGFAPNGVRYYAGFRTLADYAREIVRILHNRVIGPSWNAGDLYAAFYHYTGFTVGADGKMAVWRMLNAVRDAYDGASPAPPIRPVGYVLQPGEVWGSAVAAWAYSQVGDAWDEEDAPIGWHHNNPHERNYFCEDFGEDAVEYAGGVRPGPYATALAAAYAAPLNPGVGPAGSRGYLGSGFYKDGHTWVFGKDGDEIGTAGAIQVTRSFVNHWAYMGWRFDPGVINDAMKGTEDMVRPGKHLDDGLLMDEWFTFADPATGGQIPYNPQSRFAQDWTADHYGEGPFGSPWGPPLGGEHNHGDGRITMKFVNGTATYWVNKEDSDATKVTFN